MRLLELRRPCAKDPKKNSIFRLLLGLGLKGWGLGSGGVRAFRGLRLRIRDFWVRFLKERGAQRLVLLLPQ